MSLVNKHILNSFITAGLILSVGLIFVPMLHAVPASPDAAEVNQPDGKKIKIHLQGDEHFSWHEDETGYVIANDKKDKFWKYAKPKKGSVEFEIIPDAVVGKKQPADLKLKKHDLPDEEALRKHIKKGREQLLMDALDPGLNNSSSIDSTAPDSTTPEPAPPQPIPISGTKTIKNVVIMACFADHWDGVNGTVLASKGRTNVTEYNNLFNEIGHTNDSAAGSVKDFYREVSYGKLTVDSVITQWVVLPQDEAFYGAASGGSSDANPRQMVVDALAAAEAAGFDFLQGDGDGDGWIDCLTILHSGHGQELSGNSSDFIWSHQWSISSTATYDGVKMKTYHTSPALRGNSSSTSIIRIGVICHEMGHFFGLPDLYDYAGAYSNTSVGKWCVMSGGSWGGSSGNRPTHFSAWCKQTLGFATPQLIHSSTSLTVPDVKASDTIYMIRDGCSNGEYFLVENRNKTGFDASTPGKGIMIWHIDPKSGNNDSGTWSHPLVKMEDADGDTAANEAASAWYSGNAGMLAGGFRDQTGDPQTNAMRYQSGNYFNRSDTSSDYTYVRLDNFSATGANMTINVSTLIPTVQSKSVAVQDYSVDWTASSDATQYEIQEGELVTSNSFTEGFEDEDSIHENWSLAGCQTSTSGKRSGSYSMLFSMYHDSKWWSSVQSMFSRNAYPFESNTAVQFYYMSRSGSGNGRFQFMASNDDGQTWIPLWTHSGGTVSAWTSINVSAANLTSAGFSVGDNLSFAFTMNTESLSGSGTFPSYGWAIDDFAVTNTSIESYTNWTTLASNVTSPTYNVSVESNGTYAYRVRGKTNGVDQSFSPIATVTVNAVGPYMTWSGGITSRADSNSDSIENGIAWVLGASSITTDATSLLPVSDNTSVADSLLFIYRRSDTAYNDPKTAIVVEYGSDLSNWVEAQTSDPDITITETADGYAAGIDKVEVKIKKSLAVGDKLFTRLKVAITP